MTEDANNKELTEAYRDLATETTPADLDDRVLQMAARETRSRYGIARAWVRPVAWAATIGLSLAIVLEVMQVIPPASEPESEAPDAAVLERPEPASAIRQDAAEMPSTVGTTMNKAPANPGGGAAEELGARRLAPQDLPEANQERAAELDDADAFAAKDMRILEDAEMQARERAGEAPAVLWGVAERAVAVAHCDETARATAESWYECIEKLREAGEEEFATIELDALRQAYPEFEVPAEDR